MDNIQMRDAQFGIEIAWHKKTKLRELITKFVAFPWQVILVPLLYMVGEKIKTHGGYVIPLADDDFLPLGNGVPLNVETYKVRNPHDVFDFAESVLAGTKYTIASAGTVGNRSKYFVSAKLNELEAIRFEDGSKMELLLNSMGSMDKTLVEQVSVSGTRIVCQNTLMLSFLNDSIKWRYRHSKNMDTKMTNDKPLIEKAVGLSAIVKETFDKLLTLPCDKDDAASIYTGFLTDDETEELSTRTRNMVDAHVECFARGDGNIGATEFDLLNGFTQLRTKGYPDSERDNYDVFTASEFGSYADDKVSFSRLLTVDRHAEKGSLAEVKARGQKLLAIN
jgi:hypothetical protein